MSVIAVTLSNRMRRTPNFVRNLHPILVADVPTRYSGKRMLKNTGGQVDTQIEDFRTTLLGLRKAFLDRATITIEITAFQILDDVGIISAKVDWISTRLRWVSNQVADAGT